MIYSDERKLCKLQDCLSTVISDIGKPDMSIPTGIASLDDKLNGLYPSDLIVIGGRPSMGKSSLLTDIALYISRNRHVLIFSLEMTAYNLTQRMLCNLAGVSLFKLRKNTLTERELCDINNTSKVLYKPNNYNISIDETTRITPDDMEETISMLNDSGDKVDCILIDYIQLMGLRSLQENRNQELSVISRQLKGIANKFGIPVVVLSQLNRSVEYRENRRPLMSDLRDCGSIEQDADVVLLLYREGYYTRVNNPDAIDNGTAEMILTKVRNGATGIAVATWDAEGMSFNPRLRLSLEEF